MYRSQRTGRKDQVRYLPEDRASDHLGLLDLVRRFVAAS